MKTRGSSFVWKLVKMGLRLMGSENLIKSVVLATVFLLGIITTPVHSSVIWRCPEFKIMSCREPPSDCQSFSMIYLRHGDLECPACLVCADPHHHEPWPEAVRKAGELRRKRERRRMRLFAKRKRKENRKSNRAQNNDVTAYTR